MTARDYLEEERDIRCRASHRPCWSRNLCRTAHRFVRALKEQIPMSRKKQTYVFAVKQL